MDKIPHKPSKHQSIGCLVFIVGFILAFAIYYICVHFFGEAKVQQMFIKVMFILFFAVAFNLVFPVPKPEKDEE